MTSALIFNFIGWQCSCTIHDIWRYWISARDIERRKLYMIVCFSKIVNQLWDPSIPILNYHFALLHLNSWVLTCRRCDICSGGGAYVVRCIAIATLTHATTVLIFGGCKMNCWSLSCSSSKGWLALHPNHTWCDWDFLINGSTSYVFMPSFVASSCFCKQPHTPWAFMLSSFCMIICNDVCL